MNPTVVHCLVVRDIDTKESWTFTDSFGSHPRIAEGLALLDTADEISGHNIIDYDLVMLYRLHLWKPKAKVFDTLIALQVLIPREVLKARDFRDIEAKRSSMPMHLVGNHSLKAWGWRLGRHKSEFDAWETCTAEMIGYCEQDTAVGSDLRLHVDKLAPSPESMEIEQEFAQIITQMSVDGFAFNEKAAQELSAEIGGELETVRQRLVEQLPVTVEEMKTPQYWTLGSWPESKFPTKGEARAYAKKFGNDGEPIRGPNRQKRTSFNPGSRPQVRAWLLEHGWVPDRFTDSGEPTVDDATFASLPHLPQAVDFARYFLLDKRLGQISTGKEGWLKVCRNGRIHGSVNTNGAVTRRCSHHRPNIGQVPKVGKPFGSECRALFTADPGWVIVGADASGLELRCLAHYLAQWDGGEYCKIVCEGDVHTTNQKAFQCPTRGNAKNGIYCVVYGGGDAKFGNTLFPELKSKPLAVQEAAGAKARESFRKAIPAYGKLADGVARVVEGPLLGYRMWKGKKYAVRDKTKARGYLLSIDKSKLFVRKAHAALNTLLQSCGAILVKFATVLMVRALKALGYDQGVHYKLVAHVHDEVQITCPSEIADLCGKAFVEGLQEAGRRLGFKCPLNGEYKIGKNWAETH